MSTTHVSATPKPGILTIPGEIRNEIYRMLLTTPYAYQQNTENYAPFHPAILRTKRQIHAEAVNILHGENIWIIAKINAGDWLPNAIRVPTISKKHAGNIKHPALHINFTAPITAKTPQSHMTLIMGEESIERFLQTLWNMSTDVDTKEKFKASSLTLTLCQVEPACAEEILYRAQSGFKDTAEIQKISQAYLEKGGKAFVAGEPWRALAQYACGAAFLRHVIFLRLREAIVATADILTLQVKNRLMSIHWARALLACGAYENAKMVGEAILASRSLPNQERVLLKLCTARAHRALGEGDDELRLFYEALNADGDKSTVLIALAELFPNAAPEQARLLAEQHGKLQKGEAIDLDAIRTFWDTV